MHHYTDLNRWIVQYKFVFLSNGTGVEARRCVIKTIIFLNLFLYKFLTNKMSYN